MSFITFISIKMKEYSFVICGANTKVSDSVKNLKRKASEALELFGISCVPEKAFKMGSENG